MNSSAPAQLAKLTFGLAACLFAAGCGDSKTTEQPGPEPGTEMDPGEVPPGGPSAPAQGWSGERCSFPVVEATEFIPLDKEAFVEMFANVPVGFMEPLHQALTQVDERSLLRSSVSMVQATYETQCREEEDWEFLPPEDDLLDEQNQQDFRDELTGFFSLAKEVQTGETLRLEVHECESCEEPIGEDPWFLNVKRTAGDLLLIEVELSEGTPWTQNIIMGPDMMALQAPLRPLSTWGETATQSLRDGEASVPDASGQVTLIASKGADNRVTWSVGLSELSVVAEPDTEDEVIVAGGSKCFGFDVQLAPREEGSSWQMSTGSLDLSLPGSSHCPWSDSCGEKERTGPFEYHVGDVNVGFAQPPVGSERSLTAGMVAGEASTAHVAGDEFARGGLGADGNGGQFDAAVEELSDSFLVTFEPALDMAGAMTISNFSEETQLDLPEWLADEVFDLTFGGDPVGSIQVPYRELCPEDVWPKPEVDRREVLIKTGGGSMQVGGGRVLEATAGQCVGMSLEDSATFTRTSDWWEAGFICQ